MTPFPTTAGHSLTAPGGFTLPALVLAAGDRAGEEFLNFFGAQIRNPNTRAAYLRAWVRFGAWCEAHELDHIADVRPLHVAAYIETLGTQLSAASVKQHRAALSKCFDFLTVRQVVTGNPVAVVAGPKLSFTKGKTPTLTDGEFLDLMDAIPTHTIAGRRDRAFIALLCYTWPRVSAALNLKRKDYYAKGKRWFVFLGEKGGKHNEVLVHHKAQDELDAYIATANITGPEEYLFRSLNRKRQLSDQRFHRNNALAMVKRRAKAVGITSHKISNHTFRATGITNYMTHGGRLDVAQAWANHADSRTTSLYDHSRDKVSLEEVERIRFERDV